MFTGLVITCFLFLTIGIVWCGCPFNWFPFHSSCYFFGNTTGVTFADAKVYCAQFQSHLVTVESKAENVFLKNMLYQLKGTTDFWVGLTDDTVEGTWTWVNTNTTAVFKDWHPGAPDSHYGDEDCATFASFATYRWNDVNCTYKYIPLCEKTGTSSGPAVG